MKYRTLGKTNFSISEVSLGTWQLGGKWGTPFDHKDAMDTLAAAYDHGANFFDTADGYQGGESERAVGEFVRNCLRSLKA
ncbi:aldo/keto reductase, partial [Lentilactobacillus parafarraginis]|uniref:aldo/keto reductase n=2 Tax=Lentilactobacillus parafarraginis TaxID=390842 RepID=UPI000B244F9C